MQRFFHLDISTKYHHLTDIIIWIPTGRFFGAIVHIDCLIDIYTHAFNYMIPIPLYPHYYWKPNLSIGGHGIFGVGTRTLSPLAMMQVFTVLVLLVAKNVEIHKILDTLTSSHEIYTMYP